MDTRQESVIDQRKKEIGGRIREARDRVGISQEMLARELGFSRIKQNRVENGRAELSMTELELLADVCKIGISYIFERS